MFKPPFLTTCFSFILLARASAITIGFGTGLVGVQDTPSDGNSNQMRQNINITDTVFLDAGTYHATTWDYNAAPDATNGAAQPVFPFLVIVNGPANHTVVAFGETIDTDPGLQTLVPFGGPNDTFTIPAGGATVAAGVQNTNGASVQNSILTDTSFGSTDHANSGNFDEAGGVGNTLDNFGHGNLTRTYAFSIEVEAGEVTDADGDGLPALWENANNLDDNDDGTTGESADGAQDGPNGALGDPDGDSLSNEEELANNTDPQEADSDGDSINDGTEIANGTNPRNADSDDDGLTDAEEVTAGTDPNDPDTDGDGRTDEQEIALGSDPNDPNSPNTIKIGFGANLAGVTDTQSNGSSNEMRQNINITDTVFLDAGTYTALSWEYNAGADLTNGGTQPTFPFLTIVNGPANHTVIAFGDTIDTEPGMQFAVPFGGENNVFTVPEGGATIAAGIQNPSANGVTNSILTDTSFGSTDHANSTNFSEAGSLGATLDSFGFANLSRTYAFAIDVKPGASSNKMQLDVDQVGGDLVISWPSVLGKLYNLRSETDLSNGEPVTWPIYDGNQDIVATPTTNTLTFPLPADSERYFVIEEFDAPPVPVFEDNFENGQGGWATGVDDTNPGDTNWELGSPDAPGPLTAPSGSNCFGTNLTANYQPDADIWLRSPAIDLSLAGEATLNYSEFRDIEETFDSGEIRILNAADNSVLAVVNSGIEGTTMGLWENISTKLPASAMGNLIKIEFRLMTDNIGDFPGWYLDDVSVTIP